MVAVIVSQEYGAIRTATDGQTVNRWKFGDIEIGTGKVFSYVDKNFLNYRPLFL